MSKWGQQIAICADHADQGDQSPSRSAWSATQPIVGVSQRRDPPGWSYGAFADRLDRLDHDR